MGLLEERLLCLVQDSKIGLSSDKCVRTTITTALNCLQNFNELERGFLTVQALFLLQNIQDRLGDEEKLAELFSSTYFESNELINLRAFLITFAKIKQDFQQEVIVPKVQVLKDEVSSFIDLIKKAFIKELEKQNIFDKALQEDKVIAKLQRFYDYHKLLENFALYGDVLDVKSPSAVSEFSELIPIEKILYCYDKLGNHMRDLERAYSDIQTLENIWVQFPKTNIRSIIDTIYTITKRYPTLFAKFHTIRGQCVHSIFINGCINSFDEIEYIYMANNTKLKELENYLNKKQNVKALILAVLLLSYNMCLEEQYSSDTTSKLKGIFDVKDINFNSIINMRSSLLKFIDWRVEVWPEKYESICALISTEYPKLPRTALFPELTLSPAELQNIKPIKSIKPIKFSSTKQNAAATSCNDLPLLSGNSMLRTDNLSGRQLKAENYATIEPKSDANYHKDGTEKLEEKYAASIGSDGCLIKRCMDRCNNRKISFYSG